MPTVPRSTRPSWLPERKGKQWSISPASGLHNSKRWRKTARLHKQQNPLCVECLKEGISNPVDHTDHIVPVRDGGDPYDPDNMQSLCKSHHFEKTMQEANSRKTPGGGGVNP